MIYGCGARIREIAAAVAVQVARARYDLFMDPCAIFSLQVLAGCTKAPPPPVLAATWTPGINQAWLSFLLRLSLSFSLVSFSLLLPPFLFFLSPSLFSLLSSRF